MTYDGKATKETRKGKKTGIPNSCKILAGRAFRTNKNNYRILAQIQ